MHLLAIFQLIKHNSEVSRCNRSTFWEKNQPMSAKSSTLFVQVSRTMILLAVPQFSQLFFKVTNVLNIMGIPYAWFPTFYIFKVHIPGANTMKYHCSKAKCFTVHIYCSRNQTINQKFQGIKTIWDKHSIQLNGMLLFQTSTPKLSVLHREGTVVTNCWMNFFFFLNTLGNNKVEPRCAGKPALWGQEKKAKREKEGGKIKGKNLWFVVFSSFCGINTCPMSHFNTNFNYQLPF